MSRPKVQHYVPKLMLQRFANGRSDQLWVLDKWSSTSFLTNLKNIAGESRFYDLGPSDAGHLVEAQLNELETEAAPILQQMLGADSTARLSDDQRLTIAMFLAVQFTCTKTMREQFREFPAQLRERFAELGEEEALTAAPDHTPEELVRQQVHFMATAPRDFAGHFLAKDWLLLGTTEDYPFFLSDNPIVLQNQQEYSPNIFAGKIGVAVRGIEIYLPLSSTRVLALWCRSIAEQFLTGIVDAEERCTRHRNPARGDLARVIRANRAILSAVDKQSVLMIDRQLVDNQNSLQLGYAERYIMSKYDCFEWAKAKLLKHPTMRSAPRITIR